MSVTSYYWYRYLKERRLIPDAHPEFDLILDQREVFGVKPSQVPGRFTVVDKSDPSIEFTIVTETLGELIAWSRPYLGLVDGQEVQGGPATVSDIVAIEVGQETEAIVSAPSEKHVEPIEVEPTAPVVPQHTTDNPSMPKKSDSPIDLVLLDKPTKVVQGSVTLNPPASVMAETIEKSSHYLGLKRKLKTGNVPISVSSGIGTCLLSSRSQWSDWNVHLIINPGQISDLFGGKVGVAEIGQVITHELAHYVSMHGIIRQSDKRMFRKKVAGLQLHKDQLNHPGYSYPWFEEAWAILCEYMVWGRSCRGLSSTLGWEIAEKYFENNFLVGGVPSGEEMVSQSSKNT